MAASARYRSRFRSGYLWMKERAQADLPNLRGNTVDLYCSACWFLDEKKVTT